MPTEALLRARRVVAAAKKRKVESISSQLGDDIADKRAELQLSKQKMGALDSELVNLRSEKAEAEVNVAELHQLKEHLTDEEYKEALSDLSKAVNDYEKKIDEAYKNMSSLKSIINQLEAQIGMLLDKKNSIEVKGDSVTNPAALGEQLMLESCRTELQDLYQEALTLKQLVVQIRLDDPWRSDVRADSNWSRNMIRVSCMIIVGKLKALQQEHELNDQEQVLLRRSLGRVGAVTKETFCGSVESLKQSAREDWPKYVKKAIEERTRLEHQAAAEKLMQVKRKESKRAEPEPEPQNPDHEKAIEFIMGSGLLDRTRGKRIGIVGGSPGRNERARRWLEEALQAKEVLWYEDKDVQNMARSVMAKGLDAVVVMTSWIAHKHSDVIKEAATQARVPLAMCRHNNRKILIEELAATFGLNGSGE